MYHSDADVSSMVQPFSIPEASVEVKSSDPPQKDVPLQVEVQESQKNIAESE